MDGNVDTASTRPDVTGEEFRNDGAIRAGGRPAARGLLSADELAPFTRLHGWRSMLAPLQTFGLIIAASFVGIQAWGHWLIVAGCVLLIATQQHALFVLAHEAAHYRLSPSRRVNEILGRLCGTLGGISMCTYRVTHRLHHNHLYGRQDPDLALNAGYPRGGWYLLRKLLIDLSGWTAPKTYAYFFGAPAIDADTRRTLRPLDDTSPALRAAARSDRWVVAAFHLCAPLLATVIGGWRGLLVYLVLWVLPLVTVMQAILRLRAVAEHGAPAGYDSALTAARTNQPGRGPLAWLIRLVFFPHHVNYHVEHHLYPAVPHYHLPALHRLLHARGLLDGAEVRHFSSTLRRVFAPRHATGPAAARPST